LPKPPAEKASETNASHSPSPIKVKRILPRVIAQQTIEIGAKEIMKFQKPDDFNLKTGCE
jgi:hypothetical protein